MSTIGPVSAPPPQCDQRSLPMGRNERNGADRLHRSLSLVAKYIRKRNMTITLITFGGAVKTMLLESQPATADVDIFIPNFTPELNREVADVLMAAAAHTAKIMREPLAGNWLNNTRILLIPPEIRSLIAREALEQRIVVFQRPGLLVYAAPWAYAFMTKLERMGKRRGAKEYDGRYDGQDAALYLHEHIKNHDRRPIGREQISVWSQRYRIEAGSDAVSLVAQLYRTKFGTDGIVM